MLLAGSLFAADAKDDVKAAAKKLADGGNYSWKSTVELAGGGPFGGPTEGKRDKDGCVMLSLSMRDTTTEAVLKGDKAAVKVDGAWKTLAEVVADEQGPGRFLGRRLQNYKAPAAEVEEIVAKSGELKADAGVIAGNLTEDGAKALLSMGSRAGGTPPANAKGSVKFWLKDGALVKYEVKVQGTVSFGGNDRDIDRTTTVEIKDVGTTKLDVPEDAKKKLS